MKILKIRLQNIHSLRGEHEINFEEGPLSQTGLFAITGPTGSGKSTLLDVITLALYNQTPRTGSLSRPAIEKLGAIITRNTENAFAEIEYETNGTCYRSKWEISRARTGNLRDYEMSLSFLNVNGDFEILDIKKSGIPDKNAENIGLSYDQFVKSILLSQGNFARFLVADPKERSELLEKITGTEIYRTIGKAAFEKQRDEKQKLELLEQKLKEIKILSSDETKILNDKLAELQVEITSINYAREKTQKAIDIKLEIDQKNKVSAKLKERLVGLETEKVQHHSDELRLQRHYAVLPLKSDIDRLASCEASLIKIADEKDQLEKKITYLQTDQKTLLQAHEKVTTSLEQVRLYLTEQEPLFTMIKNKDQEIIVQKNRKNETEKQLAVLLSSITDENKNLDQSRHDLSDIDRKINIIKQFIEKNPMLVKIGDQLPALEENHRLLDKGLKEFHAGISTEFPEMAMEIRQYPLPEEKEQFLAEQIHKTKSELDELMSLVKGKETDTEIIQQNIREIEKIVGLFDEGLRESDAYLRMGKIQTATELKMKEFKTSLDENLWKETQVTQSLEIVDKHITELQARKEREALEARYDEARTLLKPGEACPLCGSTHHPLVGHYVNRISETEKLLRQKLTEHKDLNALKENILAKKTTALAGIQNAKVNLDEIVDSLRLTKEAFQSSLNKAGESFSINDTEGLMNRKGQLLDDVDELKKIAGIIAKTGQLQPRLKSLSHFHDKVSGLCRQQEDFKVSLNPYREYFGQEDNTGIILSELSKQYDSYRKAKEDEQKLQVSRSATIAMIAEKERIARKLQQEHQDLVLLDQSIGAGLSKLTGERDLLFGDKDPDTEKGKLDDMINNFVEEVHQTDKKIQVGKTELENSKKRLDEIHLMLSETEQESQRINVNLMPALLGIGLQSPEEAHAVILTSVQTVEIRQKLDGLKEETTKTKQSLDDLDQTIEKLKTVDDTNLTVETLRAMYLEQTQKASATEQEIGAIRQKLIDDNENRIRHAGVMEETEKQEKEFARWDVLNRLIGDGKGHTFSRFAQELTLTFMLSKANEHLRRLTDRYIVKYEKTDLVDDLFVIDTYRGDEKRSVKTLSGGESFQVSLALALGLSDLAGNKTRISSLFIDEGFGTLDQETLDTALSALEKLQHETKRTIGVISHVPALRERITTQIELIKDPSGNSRLIIKE